MKPDLSKQQEAVLTRAQTEGGDFSSTSAYAALIDLVGSLRESVTPGSASSILQSLVELGLMVKSAPGKYRLTEEGSRVAESFAEL